MGRYDLYWFGTICIHSVRFVLVRYDLYWFGTICIDSVRFVLVRYDLYWLLVSTYWFGFQLSDLSRFPMSDVRHRRRWTMAAATMLSGIPSRGIKSIHNAIYLRGYHHSNVKLESVLSLCQHHNHQGQRPRGRHQLLKPILLPLALAAEIPPGLSSRTYNHQQISFRRGYVNPSSSDAIANPSTNPFTVSNNSLNSIAAETNSNENPHDEATLISTGAGSKSNGNGDLMDTYAVAIITSSDTDGNMKLSTKNLSIQQIVKEVIPGTHPRDFFSLALTSLGDASRKRKIMMKTHYSLKNTINPWFILPRETEIVVSDTVQDFARLIVTISVLSPFSHLFCFALCCVDCILPKDVFWLCACNYRKKICVHL